MALQAVVRGHSVREVRLLSCFVSAAANDHLHHELDTCRRFNRTRAVSNVSLTGRCDTDGLKSIADLPGDRPSPVIGFLKDIARVSSFQRHSFRYLYETFCKHGDLARYNFFGFPLVLVADPKVVEDILRQEDAQPSNDRFQDVFRALFRIREELNIPKGLIQMEGQEWSNLRQLLSKRLLRPIEVKNYFDGFCSSAESLVDEINRIKDPNGIIEDLSNELNRWALESLGTFVFGKKVGLLSQCPDEAAELICTKVQGFLDEAMLLSRHEYLRYLHWLRYIQVKDTTRKLNAAGLQLVERIMERIQTAIDHGEEIDDASAKSFVAYLMTKDQLSAQEVVTYALDMFSAGLDTTSTSTAALVYYISSNPEKQAKLYEEIQTCVPDDTVVTHSKCQQMPYLRACLKESARLFPVAHVIGRVYEKDIQAGGYHFPAKTILLCSNYNMGRSEKLFPDPLAFKPERWLRSRHKDEAKSEDIPHPFSSMPFGFGPRSCVGRRIAEAQMQTVFVYLLKNFNLRYLGEEQIGICKPFLKLDKPLRLSFDPR